MGKKKSASIVVPFSQGVCTTSEVQDTHPEKTPPPKKIIPDYEFKSDLENLSATALKSKYPQEYNSWRNMKSRCKKKGLELSPELEDFRDFLRYCGQAEENGHTLDRKDNSKGYVIGNVRWASKVTQSNNKGNATLTIDGATHTVAEWSKVSGTSIHTIRDRMKKFPPWSDYECVYGKVPGPTKPPHDLSLWKDLRPSDIPEDREWPAPWMLEAYNAFRRSRRGRFRVRHGEKGKVLPPSVWLAARICYQLDSLAARTEDYDDPRLVRLRRRLRHDVGPNAVNWLMVELGIPWDSAFDFIRELARKTQ